MIKRNEKGQFVKGIYLGFGFKEGHAPWDKGVKRPDISRENNPSWKGGRYKTQNRWRIHQPNHSFSDRDGYVLRYRFVAEQCLHRQLSPKEVIHHINGITDDDRPENLYLFSTDSEHQAEKHLKNKPILKSNLV